MDTPSNHFSNDESSASKQNSKSFASGITAEWKPNSYINKSICESTWHNYYLDSSELEIQKLDPNLKNFQSYELKYFSIVKKYYNDTKTLKNTIKELKSEITETIKENEKLKNEILKVNEDFSLQIQNIEARHQHKQIRAKNDLDSFVSSLEAKLTQKISKNHQELIEKIKNHYEEQIFELKNNHEVEIIQITENEIESKIKELTEKIEKETQEKWKNINEKQKNDFEAQILKIRKENTGKVLKNKKKLSFSEAKNLESQNPCENLEIAKNIENNETWKTMENYKNNENLEKKINELQDIIKDQEKCISDMSLSLGSSMKKRQPLTAPQIEKILQIFQYFLLRSCFSESYPEFSIENIIEKLKEKLKVIST